MSVTIKKQNPQGLDLAYAHQSAVSKVRSEQVYENIEKAKSTQKPDPEDRALSRAVGLRSIVDRLERLGQRSMENRDVAPADRLRMSQEFEVLKQELQTLLDPKLPPVALQGGNGISPPNQLNLEHWTPAQASRLADGIFAGELKAKDAVNMLGKVIDPEADPLQINLKGRLRLSPESLTKPFDTVKYLNDRKTYPLQLDPPYPTAEWITTTAQSIRSYVLENAASAVQIHGAIGTQDPTLKISI
jgi:hypothetical protein